MSRPKTRLRAPALLIAALAALLVFAATASAAAETLTGESTTASTEGAPSGETLLVKSTALYETATGHAVISFTTAAPPSPLGTGYFYGGFSTLGCTSTPPSPFTVDTVLIAVDSGPSVLLFQTELKNPTALAYGGNKAAPVELPVEKTVSGATTTLSVTSASLVEAGFKCALIFEGGQSGSRLMTVPITAAPPPPPPAPDPVATPVAAPGSTPAPAPAPLPAPTKLSLVTPKPLKLAVGKSKMVDIKVSNTGATATAKGTLKLKAAKGVLVKPEIQRLPVLTPGETFTVSVRVQLTEKAKPTSKLPVTVTAPGVSATGSIVLKLKQ
jgi:hypothetical protein